MKTNLDKYFKDERFWIFGAAFKTLNKRFNFDQIDLKEYNKLYQRFLKLL